MTNENKIRELVQQAKVHAVKENDPTIAVVLDLLEIVFVDISRIADAIEVLATAERGKLSVKVK